MQWAMLGVGYGVSNSPGYEHSGFGGVLDLNFSLIDWAMGGPTSGHRFRVGDVLRLRLGLGSQSGTAAETGLWLPFAAEIGVQGAFAVQPGLDVYAGLVLRRDMNSAGSSGAALYYDNDQSKNPRDPTTTAVLAEAGVRWQALALLVGAGPLAQRAILRFKPESSTLTFALQAERLSEQQVVIAGSVLHAWLGMGFEY